MGPDPMSDFSISLEMNHKSNDIDEILQLPEKIAQKKGCNIVVCIDEFQQIAEFKDSKTFQNGCVPYGSCRNQSLIVCSAARNI